MQPNPFGHSEYIAKAVQYRLSQNLNQLHNHEIMKLAKTLEPEKAEAFINTIGHELATLERIRLTADERIIQTEQTLDASERHVSKLQENLDLERAGTRYLRWGFFFSLFSNLCFIYLIFFS